MAEKQGKILVMDDEELVRSMAQRMLDYLGYEAETAENGEAALALFDKAKAGGSPFDAVLLDLNVRGGMGGAECAKLLLEKDPAAKIIVSSGTSDEMTDNYREHGFVALASKPYDMDELGALLATVTKK